MYFTWNIIWTDTRCWNQTMYLKYPLGYCRCFEHREKVNEKAKQMLAMYAQQRKNIGSDVIFRCPNPPVFLTRCVCVISSPLFIFVILADHPPLSNTMMPHWHPISLLNNKLHGCMENSSCNTSLLICLTVFKIRVCDFGLDYERMGHIRTGSNQ